MHSQAIPSSDYTAGQTARVDTVGSCIVQNGIFFVYKDVRIDVVDISGKLPSLLGVIDSRTLGSVYYGDPELLAKIDNYLRGISRETRNHETVGC
jgi:hypothetical protein